MLKEKCTQKGAGEPLPTVDEQYMDDDERKILKNNKKLYKKCPKRKVPQKVLKIGQGGRWMVDER